MAVTTWRAIRDIMIAQIHAIAPDNFASVKFNKDRGEGDFREWAAEHATQARRFAVVHMHEYDPVQNSDLVAKVEPQKCQVVVAYPNKWPENDRDELDAIIDEDRRAIDAVVGMDATAYPNSCMTESEFDVDRGEKVTLLTLEYSAIYYRSV